MTKFKEVVNDWCPVCGRMNTWGCGHTSEQRSKARRHNESTAHRSGACWHYDHADCDPETCKLAGNLNEYGERLHKPGYAPLLSHRAQHTRHERMV